MFLFKSLTDFIVDGGCENRKPKSACFNNSKIKDSAELVLVILNYIYTNRDA